MQITVDTDRSTIDEYTALIALFASLGGRLPQTAPTARERVEQDRGGVETVTVPPSERLMAAASAGMRPAPPVPAAPGSDDEGDQPDPNAPEYDSAGIRWDERIHSRTKATVADGTWRKRRGVDEVTFGRVYAELQAEAAARGESSATTGTEASGTEALPSTIVPTAPVAPTAPAAPPVPAPPTATSTTGVPDAPLAEAPAAPSAPTVPPPPAAASAPAAGGDAGAGGDEPRWANFGAFVGEVGKFGPEVSSYVNLNAKCQMLGVEKFASLKDHPDKWAELWALLGGE